MAGAYYLVNSDLGLLASTVSTGSAQSGFPIANAFDEAIWRPWKSNVTTVNQYVAVDYGSAIGVPDFAFVGNHNLPSAGTYRIQSASNSGFSTDLATLATFTFRATDMFVNWTAGTARQFLRFLLVDSDGAAGAFASKPQAGQVVWGVKTQLTRGFVYGAQFGEEWNNIQGVTNGGHIWSLEVNSGRDWTVSLTGQTEAEKDEWGTLVTATKGNHTPFVFVPQPDDPAAAIAARCYYVRAQPRFSYTDSYLKQITGISIMEERREISLT